MSDTFSKDCFVLAEKGKWQLVVYANRCISLLKKDGSEIKSLGCCVEDDEGGYVKDEAHLLDQLGDMFLLNWKKSKNQPTGYTAEDAQRDGIPTKEGEP